MDRRRFLKVTTRAGIVTLAAGAVDCTSPPGIAIAPWSGPSQALNDEDVRLRIAAWGLLAPSFQNRQPWWIEIKDPGLTVAIEPARIPHAIDSAHRLTTISMGAFAETLSIAATRYGLKGTIVPLTVDSPAGAPHSFPAFLRVDLEQGGTQDPLFSFIADRRTSREAFGGPPLTAHERAEIATAAAVDGTRLAWFSGDDVIRHIADQIHRSTIRTLSNAERFREVAETIRWSEDDVNARRDGIPLDQLGLTWLERMRARVFIGAANADAPAFRESLQLAAFVQASSAPTFGVIVTDSPDRWSELAAGRLLMRVYLAATRSGLAVQPMADVLVDESSRPDISRMLAADGGVPQILFRIGRAPRPDPTPRRSLFEIVSI